MSLQSDFQDYKKKSQTQCTLNCTSAGREFVDYSTDAPSVSIVLKVRDNLFCKVLDINIVYWLLVF